MADNIFDEFFPEEETELSDTKPDELSSEQTQPVQAQAVPVQQGMGPDLNINPPFLGAVDIQLPAIPQAVDPNTFDEFISDRGIRVPLPPPPVNGVSREDLRAPEIVQFEKENPELAAMTDLQFFFSPDVAKSIILNTPGSLGRLFMDFVSLADPGFGKDVPLGSFPNITALAQLIRELNQLAAVEMQAVSPVLTGGIITQSILLPESLRGLPVSERRKAAQDFDISEFELLPGVMEFYKQNYSIGAKNAGGFRRYVTEDPAAFASDVFGIAALLAGTVGKGAKGAQLAIQVGEASRLPRAQKLISRLNADKFLVPLEKWSSTAKQAFDYVDPAALPVHGLRLGGTAVRRGIARATDFGLEVGFDQRIADLNVKYKLNLPASAQTTSRLVALLEGVAVNLGDPELILRAQKADTDLMDIMRKMIDDIDGSGNFEIAGQMAIKGMESFKDAYEAFASEVYNKYGDAGGFALPANTDFTFAMLSQVTERRGQALGGLGENATLEDILTDLEDRRGEKRLRGQEIRDVRPVETGIDETADIAVGGRQVRTVFGKDPAIVYRVRYKVVPLETLIPSHLDNFAENPAFPQNLQPRGRDRVAAQQQVIRNAARLEAAALITDIPALNKGAPIVGRDNLVESGNGRVLMMRRAKALHPDRWQAYQARLAESVSEYGINMSILESMDNPVLVRERLTDVDRVQFVRDATEGGLDLSPLEKSQDDAKLLSDDAIGRLQVAPNETLIDALGQQKNNEFITAFSGALHPDDAAGLADAGGKLNRVGVVRISNALLAKTYTNGLLSQFTESIAPGMKNVEKALLASLPEMAQVEALIRTGARGELSLVSDIEQAVIKAKELRGTGTSIHDFMLQGTLIDDDLSDAARILLPIAEKAFTSPKEFRTFLQRYAAEVGRSGNPNQSMLYDTGGPVSKEFILAKVAGESFDGIPDISALYDEITSPVAASGMVASAEPTRRPLTFSELKETRTIIGEMIDTQTLIDSGLNKIYKSLYKSLSEDMNRTVKAHRPDLAPLIDQATAIFREGRLLSQSKVGKKFWKFKDSPSMVVPAFLAGSTSVEDVGRLREILGGDGTPEWREMQAATLTLLLDKSLNLQKNWDPNKLGNQLRTLGKPKMIAIFGSEVAEAIQEVSEISASFARLKKVTEGSQTGFLNRLTTTGALTAIASVYGGGIPGAAVFATSVVGDKVFRRWLVSDAGQSWLLGGRRVGSDSAFRFQQGDALVGRAAFQLGRASKVGIERSVRDNPRQ